MQFFLLRLWNAAAYPTFYSWQVVDLQTVWMGAAGVILFPLPAPARIYSSPYVN